MGSRDEVHTIVEPATRHGAQSTREPAETFYGGFADVFCDLDGSAWEVAYNPGFGLTADGSVIVDKALDA